MSKNPENEDESQDPGVVKSIWTREGTHEKLLAIRDGLGLSIAETLELMMEQVEASGILPEETRERVKEIRRAQGERDWEDRSWRESFGLGESWAQCGSTLARIAEENQKIREELGVLIETTEDHMETMVILEENT